MRELLAWVEAGRVVPVIDREFRLADGIQAIQYVTGRNVRGKVVVKP